MRDILSYGNSLFLKALNPTDRDLLNEYLEALKNNNFVAFRTALSFNHQLSTQALDYALQKNESEVLLSFLIVSGADIYQVFKSLLARGISINPFLSLCHGRIRGFIARAIYYADEIVIYQLKEHSEIRSEIEDDLNALLLYAIKNHSFSLIATLLHFGANPDSVKEKLDSNDLENRILLEKYCDLECGNKSKAKLQEQELNLLELLPRDMLEEIIKYLDLGDILSLRGVSRHFPYSAIIANQLPELVAARSLGFQKPFAQIMVFLFQHRMLYLD